MRLIWFFALVPGAAQAVGRYADLAPDMGDGAALDFGLVQLVLAALAIWLAWDGARSGPALVRGAWLLGGAGYLGLLWLVPEAATLLAFFALVVVMLAAVWPTRR
jgi:hypothetical protein